MALAQILIIMIVANTAPTTKQTAATSTTAQHGALLLNTTILAPSSSPSISNNIVTTRKKRSILDINCDGWFANNVYADCVKQIEDKNYYIEVATLQALNASIELEFDEQATILALFNQVYTLLKLRETRASAPILQQMNETLAYFEADIGRAMRLLRKVDSFIAAVERRGPPVIPVPDFIHVNATYIAILALLLSIINLTIVTIRHVCAKIVMTTSRVIAQQQQLPYAPGTAPPLYHDY